MVLRIYDFLHGHRMLRWGVLVVSTIIMVLGASTLSYREDIADFLPLDSEERQTMDIYQDISGADNLVVIFENASGEDTTMLAVDAFVQAVQERDTMGWGRGMLATIDMEQQDRLVDYVYANIPYFLTTADYMRMDSCLSRPDFIPTHLQEVQEMLMLPGGGFLADHLVRDPLGLFSLVLAEMQGSAKTSDFSLQDGYIFTPDMKYGLVLVPSPFGNSETAHNALLLDMLQEAMDDVNASFPAVKARMLGGPQIAVGNADRIRQDSILAVSLSMFLVLALLIATFRSFRNIMLVGASVLWGALFALACMSVFRDSVSIIVIGISSIIMGIAVNYPLHVIAHTAHQKDIRAALRELQSPLVIGNITTVGAFLALLPLQSTALQDLGLFASLLLVGTIVFVLLFLPHLLRVRPSVDEPQDSGLLYRISRYRPERNRFLVLAVLLLTPLFAWFSQYAGFDSNVANLNYMTEEQKGDMALFKRLTSHGDTLQGAGQGIAGTRTMYLATSCNTMAEALEQDLNQRDILDALETKGFLATSSAFARFVPSGSVQDARIASWASFVCRHSHVFNEELPRRLEEAGFLPETFAPFFEMLGRDRQVQDFSYFAPLSESLFRHNFSTDSLHGRYTVVRHMEVKEEHVEDVRSAMPSCFDSTSMNKALADSLSDNFNYIGWICSAIVFLFLWLSFRSLRIAIVCFLPMAVSWIWILGIMGMFGIEFNLINIILATFIFGQGDDYTIFMVEGCLWERRHGRPMLYSYKRGIILSALIMFAGIGTLIFAKHPALHSLAEVTLIGMASVVLMAWLLPPLLFRMADVIVNKNKQ